ncbi:MAG: tRNA (adenosine(37)-N6)-dimethylallyltransferase MiaA [Anaerolineae bacterium]|nr:tRNA (adenosine(37)-N6)-dimethylallyltransferase MiaA [Anaerolineae bacterium]
MADLAHPPLLAIVGPTAVGKTAVSIELAKTFDSEIVSADSRQVYRLMDIGTAKPTHEERESVPHHLVDILLPDESLTLASYQSMAYAAIDSIHERQSLPIFVGGTGQYVRALIEGWGIPQVPPQPALRADLNGFAAVYSARALHDWLAKVDPAAASSIDYRNVRRIVRAIEVYLVTGTPISVLQRKSLPPYRILKVGLTRPRDVLYARIDRRVDQMIETGLLDEIRKLLESGYGWDLPSMSSLGYIQFADYLAGEISLDDAIHAVKKETRRFVRQQYTWFRLDDPSIAWFDLEQASLQTILDTVQDWL